MRFLIASLVVSRGDVLRAGGVAGAGVGAGSARAGAKLDVDINVGHSGGSGAWWNNPIWIAIGVSPRWCS